MSDKTGIIAGSVIGIIFVVSIFLWAAMKNYEKSRRSHGTRRPRGNAGGQQHTNPPIPLQRTRRRAPRDDRPDQSGPASNAPPRVSTSSSLQAETGGDNNNSPGRDDTIGAGDRNGIGNLPYASGNIRPDPTFAGHGEVPSMSGGRGRGQNLGSSQAQRTPANRNDHGGNNSSMAPGVGSNNLPNPHPQRTPRHGTRHGGNQNDSSNTGPSTGNAGPGPADMRNFAEQFMSGGLGQSDQGRENTSESPRLRATPGSPPPASGWPHERQHAGSRLDHPPQAYFPPAAANHSARSRHSPDARWRNNSTGNTQHVHDTRRGRSNPQPTSSRESEPRQRERLDRNHYLSYSSGHPTVYYESPPGSEEHSTSDLPPDYPPRGPPPPHAESDHDSSL